jgi:hypothetical protein
MVAGFDVLDFLQVLTDRSVQLLDVSAAGPLLADSYRTSRAPLCLAASCCRRQPQRLSE